MADDPRLKRIGVAGYNQPKRTPGHPTKSHVVVAKSGDTIKTIRFGEQGASTAGKPNGSAHPGNTHKMKDGSLHSGAAHTASSVQLFHYKELNKKARTKAKTSWGK